MSHPLVSVNIVTYNHVQYIRECIDSILMQETSFPYEILIGEDNSTDGTREIVLEYHKKYPETVKIITSDNNVGALENARRSILACKSKYFASCEGDDFWTDPLKLQKQVEFLENNPDYGLVHTDITLLYEDTKREIQGLNNNKIPSGDIFDYLMKPSHAIKTMTVCVRNEILQSYMQFLNGDKFIRYHLDLTLWLYAAQRTKIKYLDEITATYRLSGESYSRSKKPDNRYQFHQRIFSIRFLFLRKFKPLLSEDTIFELYKSYYYSLFSDGLFQNRRIMFRGKKGLENIGIKLLPKEKALFIFKYLGLAGVLTFIKYFISKVSVK